MKRIKFLAMMLIAISCMAFTACSSDDDEEVSTLSKFTISQTSLSMTPGENDTLTCSFYPENISNRNVAWSSSDESVATVADGVITAVAPGSATITATPEGNPSQAQTCNVSVTMNQVKVSGKVEGTWNAYTTYVVEGQLEVEAGKSLTIEKGVQVIFNSNDGNGAGIEFTVHGNIYCNGTADAPILFSIPEEARTFDNVLNCKNLWGGFMLNSSDPKAEALFNYCEIEYTGSLMTANSPSVISGIYTENEDNGVQITTGPDFKGSLVVENCSIRNGYADGIYMQGGKGIITHNTFYCNGATGGEAVNVKAGTSTTVAYNVMYSPNTNGLKLSSSGQDDTAGRGQAKCVAYNNTIINAGWRRDGSKGGCIYVEKNILANVFNNLMVNCKFRAMTPSWGNPGIKDGCDLNSKIDYNCYISGSVESPFAQDKEEGGVKTPFAGYNMAHENYYDAVDAHSVIAKAANDINIQFVGFDYNTVGLDNVTFDPSWNFAVTSMVDGATDGSGLFTLSGMDFVNAGLTVGGKVYKAEAPQKFFGAYGK